MKGRKQLSAQKKNSSVTIHIELIRSCAIHANLSDGIVYSDNESQ